MQKRVVITGLGPVTPIGIGNDAFWDSLISGKSAIKVIDFPGYDMKQFSSTIAAPVDDFMFQEYVEPSKDLKYLGRISRFALVGSLLALKNAGYEMHFTKENGYGYYRIQGIDPEKCGIILGVGSQDMALYDHFHEIFQKYKGPQKLSPFALPQINMNAVSVNLSIKFGLKGTCLSVSTACTSSSHAIIEAYKQIVFGKEIMILTGGAEACITPSVFGGFSALNAMSHRIEDPSKASRPFDRDRDGFVMGEGAGMIILEELSHAQHRSAPIWAEVIGYGVTSDAYHITAPNPDAQMQAKAIKDALQSGNILPKEIDYINAHGTSTPLNDPIETLAIKKALGSIAYEIPISSTKSMTGHLIGACGAVEIIALSLMMKNEIIHPTINLDHPAMDCDLNYVPRRPIERRIRNALKLSFGFGGQNAVLLLKKGH